MGLLDLTPELRQGLLAAGLGMMGSRGSLPQAISQGGLMGMQAYGGAQDRARSLARQDDEDAWRKTQRSRETQQWQRQQELEDLRRRAAQGAVTGGTPPITPWSGAPMTPGGPNPGATFDGQRYAQTLLQGGDMEGGLGALERFTKSTPKPVELNDGASLIDPVTGRVIAERQKTFGPTQAPALSDVGKLAQEMYSLPQGHPLRAIYQAQLTKLTTDAEKPVGLSYQTDASGNVVALPDKLPPGGQITPIQTGVKTAKEVPGSARVQEASDAISLIRQARDILNQGPTNSYAGSILDQLGGAVGVSTKGAQLGAQLKALQGALISKMPRMQGPQSDKDVQLYREMAGQVGDATVPVKTRLAALRAIEEMQRKYAGQEGRTVVRRGTYKDGRKVVEYSDGTRAFEQ